MKIKKRRDKDKLLYFKMVDLMLSTRKNREMKAKNLTHQYDLLHKNNWDIHLCLSM